MNRVSSEQEQAASPIIAASPRIWIVNVTSFLFILLQSACTVVIAFSGISAAVGLGSFATALGLTRLAGSFHADIIRIPMMSLALAGSVASLYVLWRVRSLRARPASQWRVVPLSPKQRRKETFQIFLSILTIVLVMAEFTSHLVLHHIH
jgi:hypothetical protein